VQRDKPNAALPRTRPTAEAHPRRFVLAGPFGVCSNRPTRPLIFAALLSAQPVADETVVAVNSATISMKDAERLNGKAVVCTYRVGSQSDTWGEGADTITVTASRPAGLD
jgi:hypothetical protein